MMKLWMCLVVAVIGLQANAMSHASMYTWTDENGVKHFSNTQPPQNAGNVKEEVEALTKDSDTSPKRSTPKKEKPKAKATANPPAHCKNSLQRCQAQYKASYDANVKLCEGDWRAVAALNKLRGDNISAKELYETCKAELKETRDKGVKSCQKSYKKCMSGR